jgi:hypothetical protein
MVRLMLELTLAPVTSEVMFSIPSRTHSSCDREGATLSVSVVSYRAPVSSYIKLQITQYCLLN